MAYASASDVAALTMNLVGGQYTYDVSTSPTITQVNVWLSTGCALIEATVGARGFGSIPPSSPAWGIAQQANALYGAWFAERSRTLARVSADERTRAEMFKKDFQETLKMLAEMDLARLGVSQTSLVYAGGISQADKDEVASDEDRVTPRFVRDMLTNYLEGKPGTPDYASTDDPQTHP